MSDRPTTTPPHPGMAGLAAREAGASLPARHCFKSEAIRKATTARDVTLAADDDSDHVRSDFSHINQREG